LSREIEGSIRSATVSRRGKHWFISVLTSREIAEPTHESSTIVGIDRGVVNLATLSDGSAFEGSKPLKRLAKKLAREQRKLARKKNFQTTGRSGETGLPDCISKPQMPEMTQFTKRQR